MMNYASQGKELNNANRQILIDIIINFLLLYEDSKKFLMWSKTSFIYIFLKSQLVKDPACRRLVDSLQSESNVSDNGKFSVLFQIIHGYLVPTTKTVQKDIFECLNITKFSIKDSQNSFLYFTQTVSHLNDRLEFLHSKGVVAVGDLLNPDEILIYFEGIKYKLTSIITAIDLCFKIFHVFNLKYPLACFAVWQFIKQYFYNIKTGKHKLFPKINLLKKILES